MQPKSVWISLALFCVTAVLGVARLSVKAADTLPGRYSGGGVLAHGNGLLRAGRDYQFENFVSNEISYQEIPVGGEFLNRADFGRFC